MASIANKLLVFANSWATLASLVLAVWSLSAFIGWGLTIVCLPRWYRYRWPCFAPLVGIALTILVGTPLLVMGWPTKAFAWPFLAVVCAFDAAVLARLLTVRPRRSSAEQVWGHLHRRWLAYTSGFAAITFVATYLITSHGYFPVTDLFGSGDIATYSAVAEFLEEYGGSPRSYESQSEFHNETVRLNITKWARQGSMGYLSFVSHAFGGARAYLFCNVIIVVGIYLTYLMVVVVLDTHRIRATWPLLVVAFHPFAYFPLCFTYLGQVLAVPLLVMTLQLIHHLCNRRQFDRSSRVYACISGGLLGSCLIAYPLTLPAIGCFVLAQCTLFFWTAASSGAWRRLATCLVLAAVTSGYFMPRVIHEIIAFSRMNPAAGWTWRSFIGTSEVIGISSVLGYDKPDVPIRARIVREGILLVIVGSLFVLGFRRTRQKSVYAVLLVASVATMAASVRNHYNGVVNSNHGFVKGASQFVLFFLVIALLPLCTKTYRLRPRSIPHRLLILFIAAAWIGSMALVLRGAYAARFHWFGPELVELVRRERDRGSLLFVTRIWDPALLDYLVRDDRRLLSIDQAAQGRPTAASPALFMSSTDDAPPSVVIDRQGRYLAGLPPRALDLANYKDRAWIAQGGNVFRLDRPTATESCSALVGKPAAFLELRLEWADGKQPAAGSSANPGQTSVKVRVNGYACGTFNCRASPETTRIKLPLPQPIGKADYCIVQVQTESDGIQGRRDTDRTLRLLTVETLDQ
jgi:hypothetical protein